MDKTSRFPIRRYASLEAMKADEYDYWQRRRAHERMAAVTEITGTVNMARPHGRFNAARITVNLERRRYALLSSIADEEEVAAAWMARCAIAEPVAKHDIESPSQRALPLSQQRLHENSR